MTTVPAKNPCGSCPYRQDAPSGLWAASEYDKLPRYDDPDTMAAPFFCHQQDGRLCAGWVGCHDMDNPPTRLGVAFGQIPLEDLDEIRAYTTSTPLFESGAQAAAHGKAEIDTPSEKALRLCRKLGKKPGMSYGR